MSDSFLQTVAIGWVFGAERFCDCVEQMTGHRPNMFWYLCWKYFAPMVMGGVFVFYCISYTPVKYVSDGQGIIRECMKTAHGYDWWWLVGEIDVLNGEFG